MSESQKDLEAFQLDLVDKFLEAVGDDIKDMRKVISNLQLFDVVTPARLVARGLLVQELVNLQGELATILRTLINANTQDTVALFGDEKVKLESEELISAFRSGLISDKKQNAN